MEPEAARSTHGHERERLLLLGESIHLKIVHHMGLMANGCYAVVDESNQSDKINLDEALPKEVNADWAQRVGKIGNLIIGRRTFELFGSHMPGIETVVISHSPLGDDGVSVVASPAEALSLLEKKGFDTALVGGGAKLISTFLSRGLVDELYINIYPLISKGAYALSENFQASLELIGVEKLNPDIVQLHYRVRR